MKFLIKAIFVLFLTYIQYVSCQGQPGTVPSEISFIILSDLHVSPGMASDSAISDIVDEINQTPAGFVIVTGDLSNTGSDAELLAVKRSLGKLRIPCYVIPGNHETNWAESAGLMINKLWGNDRFVFSHKGFKLIGFNTGPFMKMGDGHVKREDLMWLRRTLSADDGRTNIVFSHYPLAEGLDDWPEVTAILKEFRCRMVFCGHGHSLRLYNFDGIPGIMCRSVILGKSPVPGYNIINIRNDSVLVFNKPLGYAVSEPSVSLNYLDPKEITSLPVSQLPDFSVNREYRNIDVKEAFRDTASIFSGPCLMNDSTLVFGNSIGFVRALNTADSKVLWETKIAGPVYSTPVAYKNIVSLGTIDGRVIGLDGSNGHQLWEVKTGRPVLAEGIVEDGCIYIGGGDSVFYKINMKTGKVLWKFVGLQGLVQGKPSLSTISVVFGAWDRHLYCLDKESGKLLWKWNNNKPQVLYSPGNIFPVCSGNRVFIVAPDRYMTALDIANGKEIWRTNRHHVRESLGASPDGSIVYAKLMEDTIIAVSSRDDHFSTLWKADAGFGYEHSPCPVFSDGKQVIASTRDGIVFAVDAESSDVVWKYKCGSSAINRFASDRSGTVWFTMMEGKITGIRTK